MLFYCLFFVTKNLFYFFFIIIMSSQKKRLLFFFCLLFGFLFDLNVIHTFGHTAGIWVILLQIVFLFFLDYATKYPPRPLTIFLSIINLLIGIWFCIFSNEVLRVVYTIILFWNNLLLLYLATGKIASTQRYRLKERGKIISAPAIMIFHFFQSFKLLPKISFKKENMDKGHLKTIVLSLAILIILLLIIVPLLMSADKIFSDTIVHFFGLFNIFGPLQHINIVITSLVLGFAMWSLYSFLSSEKNIINNNKKDTDNDSKTSWPSTSFSTISVSIILGWLSLVYLLFILIQVKYLFFGTHEMLQAQGFVSYAQYIHQGFYQLVIVALINMGLFHIITHRTQKNIWTTVFLSVLLCCSFLISFSGLYRLFSYIPAYWLTHLRWFVVHGILIVMIMHIFFGVTLFYKENKNILSYFAFGFYVVIGSLVITWFINIDKQIAKYNVDRYLFTQSSYNDQEYKKYGKFRKKMNVDRAYLLSLSSDAIDIQYNACKKDILNCSSLYSSLQNEPPQHWFYYTRYDAKAKKVMETMRKNIE